jgi:hypothetical protein
MRGTSVGAGVALWLGIESGGIEVGEGRGDCCGRLLLSESLVMPLDDKDDVVIFSDPHAISNTSRERHSSPQQVFFLKQSPFLLFTPLFLNAS